MSVDEAAHDPIQAPRLPLSLLSDASSALGVPGWAVPISAGIYGLSAMVERRMRPAAKSEIGAFLDHGTLRADLPPIAGVVRAAFLATFGARQCSWRCFSRTLTFSVFAVYAICLLIWAKHGAEIRARMPDLPSLPAMMLMAFPTVAIGSTLRNWVSIGKTRLILRWLVGMRGLLPLLVFVVIDFVLSYVISVGLYWTFHLATGGRADLCETAHYNGVPLDCAALANPLVVVSTITAISNGMLMRALSDASAFEPTNILAFADGTVTLLTSIWSVLIIASLLLLRALLPVNALLRGARWAFDLKVNPVRSLGAVIAALVWLGALAYAVV